MPLLFIAEKPSLARAILTALPKPHQRHDGYYVAGNGDVVSWCIGHLLEAASPEQYDPRYKAWRLHDLPIIPSQWQYHAKKSTAKQLTVLKKLIQTHDHLVHAGDPDREGQLLVDELFNYCQVPSEKRRRIERCLINDLTPDAVRKAIAERRKNSEFIPLSISALARSRADWLYGINLSRFCTLKRQASGRQGVFSVGRVQTPLLGLVVKRDLTIEQFVSHPFYELMASIVLESGAQFQAKWRPGVQSEPFLDDEQRLIDKTHIEQIQQKVQGQPAQITQVKSKKTTQAPPLPFNLSQLQIDMARQKGLSAQQVLTICQSLYEKHQLITYPRSDARYLPTAHYGQRQALLTRLKTQLPHLASAIDQCDPSLRSSCWNDARVEAHHAIIPTLKQSQTPLTSLLSQTEFAVYEAIVKYYIVQFYPAAEFAELHIEAAIDDERFTADAKQQKRAGWLDFIKRSEPTAAQKQASEQLLTLSIHQGEQGACRDSEIIEKATTPPLPFTDASLLSAMTGIARFVKDPAIKKILRATDGLGTEATRSGIIELLFKREFLTREGKTIRSTAKGRQLIQSLPDEMTTPDMTAHWEQCLDEISRKALAYQNFMGNLERKLFELMQEIDRQT